jgi:hypothetical protein
MGRKYITNQQDINYVYPNNIINQYDVEIVHDINNNCVLGSVSNFAISGYSSTGLTITFDYTWFLNGAERMLNWVDSATMILSLHGMNAPNNIYGTPQGYFNPWRMLTHVTGTTTTTSQSGSVNTGVLVPAMFGLATFPAAPTTFEFEIRMISRNCVLPICQVITI